MLVAPLPGVRGPVGALTAPTGCLKPLNRLKNQEFYLLATAAQAASRVLNVGGNEEYRFIYFG